MSDKSIIPWVKAQTQTFDLQDQMTSELDPNERSRLDGTSCNVLTPNYIQAKEVIVKIQP